MLSSIHPLGERARHNRWGVTVAALVIGSTAGGAAAGLAAGLVGAGIQLLVGDHPAGQLALVAVVVVVALAIDLGLFGLRVPTVRRQVDERWLGRYRGWVYGVGFGFQLGLGVVTVVTTAAIYAMLAIAVISGSVVSGLVIGATFGLVRGLTVLPARGLTTPDRLRSFHARLDKRRRLAAGLVPAGEAAVVVFVVGLFVAGVA
jgi:hypothetical protein